MMTLAQISTEVERLGYEYAEGIIGDSKEIFFERFNVQLDEQVLDKVDIDEFVTWVGSDGDAFPEQVWTWAGSEEWIDDNGTVRWVDENGNIEESGGDCFESDWSNGIRQYIEEHFTRSLQADQEVSPKNKIEELTNLISKTDSHSNTIRETKIKKHKGNKKNPSFRFERARFNVTTGPTSLFQRVRFVMGGVRQVKIDGAHFLMRVKERNIPAEVVKMVASFDASCWSVITAEVRIDKGKFVASSWGREYNGRYYVVIIGLGDIAETIYDTDLPVTKFRPGRLKNCLETRTEFYKFVERVNHELMESESNKSNTP